MKFILLTIALCLAQIFSAAAVPAESVDDSILETLYHMADQDTQAKLEVHRYRIAEILVENEELKNFITPELEIALVRMLTGVEAHSDAGHIVGSVILVAAEIIVDAYELALVYKKCDAMTNSTQQGICFTRFSIKILTSINDIRLTIQSLIKRNVTNATLLQEADRFYDDMFGDIISKLQVSN